MWDSVGQAWDRPPLKNRMVVRVWDCGTCGTQNIRLLYETHTHPNNSMYTFSRIEKMCKFVPQSHSIAQTRMVEPFKVWDICPTVSHSVPQKGGLNIEFKRLSN